MRATWSNQLYFGDNLAVLREHVVAETVDLVYLDPPFNSNATYNVLFRETSGNESAAQIIAFDDTWHWGMEAESAYHDLVTQGGRLADLIQAIRRFLGQNDMMAYLTMMAPRLNELHRVLKPTGSLYLHCDPTASHYLKLLLDATFGPSNYRNDLVWWRSKNPKGSQHAARRFGVGTDNLLYYTKSDEYQFYEDAIRIHLTDEDRMAKYPREDAHGRYADGPILRSDSMCQRTCKSGPGRTLKS